MKTKTIKIKDIVIDAGTQQRERINESIVAEYAEAIKCGTKFPPIVVFSDTVNFYLSDGFHRVGAHEAAGIDEIEADIHNGNLDDATLFSYGCNKSHGLRMSQADKRKAVLGMIQHRKWGLWTNRDIAKHIGVSHTYVNKLRDQLESEQENESGNVSTNNKKSSIVQEVNKTLSKDKNQENNVNNQEPEFNPEEYRVQELEEAVKSLDEENTRLKDALATNQLPDDIEIQSAEEIIKELRQQVINLEAELAAVKASRDSYLIENKELKNQCNWQQNKLRKLEAVK